ncbi:tRNA dimethylallyltransferase [Diplonema papillatum]|nr:tRNA dimethylallyltransferase [Diplonema papillatum]
MHAEDGSAVECAAETPPPQDVPIIFVIGSTGTGKSKLAVHLATWLRDAKGLEAEIINADAMQMYKGLPVATNQVTGDEDHGVKHRLLGYLDPLEGPEASVVQFTRDASLLIDDMVKRNVVPIVCGGSNYYVQALLFRDQLVSEAPAKEDKPQPKASNEADSSLLPGGSDDSVPHAKPSGGPATAASSGRPSCAQVAEALCQFDRSTAAPKKQRVAASPLYLLLKKVCPAAGEKVHANDVQNAKKELERYLREHPEDGETAGEFTRALTMKGSAATAAEKASEGGESGRLPSSVVDVSVATSIRTAEDLHMLLQQVDPLMAGRYHPRDTRRVRRSLEVYSEEGVPQSDVIRDQNKEEPRYLPAGRNLVLWVDCERSVLYPRLDARVDKMVANGIQREATSFWEKVRAAQCTDDLGVKGLLGAIGFKEFHPFLAGVAPLETCIQTLKTNTRRYAKQQVQWIRNRFATREQVPIFRVDSTDVKEWSTRVGDPSTAIVNSYLEGRAPSVIFQDRLARNELKAELNPSLHECETCSGHPVVSGTRQWELHCASKKHRAGLKRKRCSRSTAAAFRRKAEDTCLPCDGEVDNSDVDSFSP